MNIALASTVKLLKTVTSLSFANRRGLSIEPTASWLASSKLTPHDRRQLVAILGSYGPTRPITLERALRTAPAELFTDRLGAFAEHALEWFDVCDQVGVVQFQLWLYDSDGGVLFKAATTTAVAPVSRSSFHGVAGGLDVHTGERLATLLRKGKKVASALHPQSQLASVTF